MLTVKVIQEIFLGIFGSITFLLYMLNLLLGICTCYTISISNKEDYYIQKRRPGSLLMLSWTGGEVVDKTKSRCLYKANSVRDQFHSDYSVQSFVIQVSKKKCLIYQWFQLLTHALLSFRTQSIIWNRQIQTRWLLSNAVYSSNQQWPPQRTCGYNILREKVQITGPVKWGMSVVNTKI